MADGIHPAAPHPLPFFTPSPDGADQLMVTTGVVVLLIVVVLGVLFFWVHSLPERLAHRSRKVQMEVVAVLCLLALLTHTHAFWVGALLLALIDLPTLGNPVERIAGSLERMAAGPDMAAAAAGTGPALSSAPASPVPPDDGPPAAADRAARESAESADPAAAPPRGA